MRNESTWWVLAAVLTIGITLLVGSGAQGGIVFILAALVLVAMAVVGYAMRQPVDAAWLPGMVIFGFLVKLAGSFARYYMVRVVYGGGDSSRYYNTGVELAQVWRSGRVPEMTGRGGFGTQVTELVTSFLFAILTPDMLGGFLIFAIIAFSGQLLLYAAFRRWAKPHQLKPYAFLIMVLPVYSFWPSSIGKDALIVFGLGLAAYSASRMLESYQVRWMLMLGMALAAVGAIRVHISLLVAGAVATAALLSKYRSQVDLVVRSRRLLVVLASVAATIVAISFVPQLLNFELSSPEDLEPLTNEIVRRTSERGTVAAGGPARSPADVPGAIALVLFRPFIFEATEVQHLLAALETTFLLGLLLWKLPAILRNLGAWRSNAYVVFASAYTVAFAIAFSAIRNLGILARQRSQVVAFFLVFVVALGFEEKRRRQRITTFDESGDASPLPLSRPA